MAQPRKRPPWNRLLYLHGAALLKPAGRLPPPSSAGATHPRVGRARRVPCSAGEAHPRLLREPRAAIAVAVEELRAQPRRCRRSSPVRVDPAAPSSAVSGSSGGGELGRGSSGGGEVRRRGEEARPGGEVAGGGGTRRVEREEMEREETDMWGPLTELVLPSNPDS